MVAAGAQGGSNAKVRSKFCTMSLAKTLPLNQLSSLGDVLPSLRIEAADEVEQGQRHRLVHKVPQPVVYPHLLGRHESR